MDYATAAALPETWFTVWANLVDLGRLKRGERLLVHGGSSGIGLVAVQLAKHLGVECIVTVGSDEKATFCRTAGASHAINYRTQDFGDEVKRLTNGIGVDVVLDMVGAPYLQRNLASLRRDGRLVYVAFLEGSKGEADLMPVMIKRLTITGSTLRPRPVAFKAQIARALRENVWPWIEAGRVRPVIFKTFEAADAAQAHALMESNQHVGKIVLAW